MDPDVVAIGVVGAGRGDDDARSSAISNRGTGAAGGAGTEALVHPRENDHVSSGGSRIAGMPASTLDQLRLLTDAARMPASSFDHLRALTEAAQMPASTLDQLRALTEAARMPASSFDQLRL